MIYDKAYDSMTTSFRGVYLTQTTACSFSSVYTQQKKQLTIFQKITMTASVLGQTELIQGSKTQGMILGAELLKNER